MIITIDGPAGSGKSTVARLIATRLGFQFLDTGAMYRAVAWAGQQAEVDWQEPDVLALLASRLNIELTENQVLVDGQDVTNEIRTLEVTGLTHYAADNPEIRAILVEKQRQETAKADFVTEGRDQATVVFPSAEFKFFLTASPEIRAKRRHQDLLTRGESVSFEEVLQKQQQRDDRDTTRKVGALRKAPDSIEINTDGLAPEEVAKKIISLVDSERDVKPDGDPGPRSKE